MKSRRWMGTSDAPTGTPPRLQGIRFDPGRDQDWLLTHLPWCVSEPMELLNKGLTPAA
jgi:hypothetical protein